MYTFVRDYEVFRRYF